MAEAVSGNHVIGYGALSDVSVKTPRGRGCGLGAPVSPKPFRPYVWRDPSRYLRPGLVATPATPGS